MSSLFDIPFERPSGDYEHDSASKDDPEGVIRRPTGKDAFSNLPNQILGIDYTNPKWPQDLLMNVGMGAVLSALGGAAGVGAVNRAKSRGVKGSSRGGAARAAGDFGSTARGPVVEGQRPSSASLPGYQAAFQEGANARINRMNTANADYGMPSIEFERPSARMTPPSRREGSVYSNPRTGVRSAFQGNRPIPMGMGHLRDARQARGADAFLRNIPEETLEKLDQNSLEVLRRLLIDRFRQGRE